MLSSHTSRALLSLGRRSREISSSSTGFPKLLHHRRGFRSGSLSSLSTVASSPLYTDQRRGDDQKRYELPGVSIPLRYSSSARLSDSDDMTYRERFDQGKEKGKSMAKKGAGTFREMWQRYGVVFVGTYFSVYVGTVATLYGGIESGVLDPAYIMSLIKDVGETKSTAEIITDALNHYPWTEPFAKHVEANPYLANLAVAWFSTKFTEPIRLGITILVVPKLARFLGYPKDAEDKVPDDVTETENIEKENFDAAKETSRQKNVK